MTNADSRSNTIKTNAPECEEESGKVECPLFCGDTAKALVGIGLGPQKYLEFSRGMNETLIASVTIHHMVIDVILFDAYLAGHGE